MKDLMVIASCQLSLVIGHWSLVIGQLAVVSWQGAVSGNVRKAVSGDAAAR
jgi:hypothetical protein